MSKILISSKFKAFKSIFQAVPGTNRSWFVLSQTYSVDISVFVIMMKYQKGVYLNYWKLLWSSALRSRLHSVVNDLHGSACTSDAVREIQVHQDASHVVYKSSAVQHLAFHTSLFPLIYAMSQFDVNKYVPHSSLRDFLSTCSSALLMIRLDIPSSARVESTCFFQNASCTNCRISFSANLGKEQGVWGNHVHLPQLSRDGFSQQTHARPVTSTHHPCHSCSKKRTSLTILQFPSRPRPQRLTLSTLSSHFSRLYAIRSQQCQLLHIVSMMFSGMKEVRRR